MLIFLGAAACTAPKFYIFTNANMCVNCSVQCAAQRRHQTISLCAAFNQEKALVGVIKQLRRLIVCSTTANTDSWCAGERGVRGVGGAGPLLLHLDLQQQRGEGGGRRDPRHRHQHAAAQGRQPGGLRSAVLLGHQLRGRAEVDISTHNIYRYLHTSTPLLPRSPCVVSIIPAQPPQPPAHCAVTNQVPVLSVPSGV